MADQTKDSNNVDPKAERKDPGHTPKQAEGDEQTVDKALNEQSEKEKK